MICVYIMPSYSASIFLLMSLFSSVASYDIILSSGSFELTNCCHADSFIVLYPRLTQFCDLILIGFLAFGRQSGFLAGIEDAGIPIQRVVGTSSGM